MGGDPESVEILYLGARGIVNAHRGSVPVRDPGKGRRRIRHDGVGLAKAMGNQERDHQDWNVDVP